MWWRSRTVSAFNDTRTGRPSARHLSKKKSTQEWNPISILTASAWGTWSAERPLPMKVTLFKLSGFTILSPCGERGGGGLRWERGNKRAQNNWINSLRRIHLKYARVSKQYLRWLRIDIWYSHTSQRPIENYIFDTHVRFFKTQVAKCVCAYMCACVQGEGMLWTWSSTQ